jgi:predicted phosphodiesterase
MKIFFFWAILLALISCENTKSIKFAVCTDVHQDLIYDATERIKTFIEDEKSDFIIQLGNFIKPGPMNWVLWIIIIRQKFQTGN